MATEHVSADPLNLDQWAFWLLPGIDIISNTLSLAAVKSRHRQLAYPELHRAFEVLEGQLRP